MFVDLKPRVVWTEPLGVEIRHRVVFLPENGSLVLEWQLESGAYRFDGDGNRRHIAKLSPNQWDNLAAMRRNDQVLGMVMSPVTIEGDEIWIRMCSWPRTRPLYWHGFREVMLDRLTECERQHLERFASKPEKKLLMTSCNHSSALFEASEFELKEETVACQT